MKFPSARLPERVAELLRLCDVIDTESGRSVTPEHLRRHYDWKQFLGHVKTGRFSIRSNHE